MTPVHSIKNKQQADRATALLGLYAVEERSATACLTDEELACLVDRRCTAEAQEQAFRHFASCESCYRQWLELSESIAEETKTQSPATNTIHPLFQPKQLAWAGSLLAAAASVVLFVNISGNRDKPMLNSQVQSTVELDKAPLPEVRQDRERKNSADTSGTGGLSKAKKMESLKMKTTMPAAVPSPVPPADQMSFKQKPASMPRLQRSMADDLLEEHAKTGTEKFSLQVSGWLAAVAQGCRSSEEDPQFWRTRYLEGKNRLHPERVEEAQLVSRLLPLLQRLQQSEGTADTCTQILHVLHDSTNR